MTDIKVKDRTKETEQVRIALALAEIAVSYQTADLLKQVFDKINEKGGEFSLDDGVEIHFAWKKKWEDYENKQSKDK